MNKVKLGIFYKKNLFYTSGTFPASPGNFLKKEIINKISKMKNLSQYSEKLHWIIAFKYLKFIQYYGIVKR